MKQYLVYEDSDFSAYYQCTTHPQKRNFSLHTHNCYELYCFMGGKGEFKIEGSTYPLRQGDILIMQPAESHYIDINPAYPYTRLAIHFEERWIDTLDPERRLLAAFTERQPGQINLYRSTDFRNQDYRIFLNNICNATEHSRIQIIANLLPLLNEIAIAFDQRKTEKTEDALISSILQFINQNLSYDISLESICTEFYISKPHLCHIFKYAIGTTVWHYITAKRLYLAQEMIRSGISATAACTKCGFGDYSAFYRAYKKQYGTSPSR